jgi:hemerythrin superfamily protein
VADDVVEVIKAQHREVDRLLEQAMSEGGDTAALLRQVGEMLTAHSRAEESFVYPAIAERVPKEGEQVHDSLAEHHHIDQLLEELLAGDPDEPGFDGKLAALVGEIRHHVEEEEEELLPALAEQTSDEDRAAMGARFADETGWTKGAGDTSGGSAGGDGGDLTRDELYEKAKEQDVPGRSSMTKAELEQAVEQD